ncbi:hypothetical protein [Paraburkholderia youngii]|uniref:hypothetical protein n=1 Tax=Paraburkholderia youngii TaxID=2782701 RepID=UPI003D224706
MNKKTPSIRTVPADFPNEALKTLLSGAQRKIGLRRINGEIYAGLSTSTNRCEAQPVSTAAAKVDDTATREIQLRPIAGRPGLTR